MPFGNYAEYNHNALREMLLDPVTTLGLATAARIAAHLRRGMPSYMLAHWVRGRTRGERMPVETAVRFQTSDTAEFYGLGDRGVLAPGMKADVNVIDLDALKLHAPQMVFDLPAGGRRLIQRAEGYRFTILSGEVTFQDGVPTEAMPGKLIRRPATGTDGTSLKLRSHHGFDRRARSIVLRALFISCQDHSRKTRQILIARSASDLRSLVSNLRAGLLYSDSMEYRSFGKTGLKVSVLGFGGSEIGDQRRQRQNVAAKILGTALDAGINVIDTAECYANSEELIGKAIANRRDEFHLFTKCGHVTSALEHLRFHEWDPRLLAKSIDESLKNSAPITSTCYNFIAARRNGCARATSSAQSRTRNARERRASSAIAATARMRSLRSRPARSMRCKSRSVSRTRNPSVACCRSRKSAAWASSRSARWPMRSGSRAACRPATSLASTGIA